MKVLGLKVLYEFCSTHRDLQEQAQSWVAEVRETSWQTPLDIKTRYASASFLSGNRVIFNLKGNKYRLLVLVNFKSQVVIIKDVGTHAEYDKWEL